MEFWNFVCEGNLEEVRGILEQSSDKERRRLLKMTFRQTKVRYITQNCYFMCVFLV